MFNTIVFTTACMAWFVSAHTAQVDNAQIQITAPDLNLEYTLYKYNENYIVAQYKNTTELYLNQYDSFIPEKNIYNALVVKIDITGQRVRDYGVINLNINCSEESYTTHYISNITKYSIEPMSIDAAAPDVIYNAALNAITEEYTFVVDNNKSTTIQKQIDLSAYIDYIINNRISIYISIDYSKPLIAANFDDVEVSTEQAGGIIHFDNDLTSITID